MSFMLNDLFLVLAAFNHYIPIWMVYGFVLENLKMFLGFITVYSLNWLLYVSIKKYDSTLLPKAFKLVQEYFNKNQIKIFVLSTGIGLLFLSKDLTFCECIIGLMVMYYLLSLCLFLRNNNVSVLALYFLFSLIYRLNNDQFPVNYAIFCIVIIHVYYLFEELDSRLKVKRLILGFKAQQQYVATHLLVECHYFSVLEDLCIVGIFFSLFYPELLQCLPEHFFHFPFYPLSSVRPFLPSF